MKETKKFFDTNRLNKGYSKTSFRKQTDAKTAQGQYSHLLPPIDIMAEYEELNPGTMKKILDMAHKEQEHRHAMDLLNLVEYEKATKLGRQFALISVAIIAISAIILAFGGHYLIAATFSLAAFGAIGVVSFIYSDKASKRQTFNRNFDPKHKVHNHRSK